MSTIKLRTAIPGPKSAALMEQRKKYVARGPFHSTPVFMDHAHGAKITDVDGNVFLDFASGIGVVNVGHTPERLVEAITAQAKRVLHAGFNVTPYESYVQLAQKLASVTPGDFEKKCLFVNSGAEAVENAIKIARAHTRRQAVVCFEHAFHGRTYMAMALTAKAKPYKEGFGPFAPEVYRMPFPYMYRDGRTVHEHWQDFEEKVHAQIGEANVAAVILEPVLGEGGFLPFPAEYCRLLREYCTRHGIVLIADEIQSGFGRTGQLFASQTLGFDPDLITMAKGLGGGLPIAAVCGRAPMMDAPGEGGVGGTYGGNPVACAAALAVLESFTDGTLQENARRVGAVLEAQLMRWKEIFPCVGDVRGLGAMRGVEFVWDRATKEPARELTAAVAKFAVENGVVLLTAGTFGNVVRFLMPLMISEAELKEGLAVVEKAVAHASVQFASRLKGGR
jgi:4-aminobutyrate aminotransferase/(S)-3-amino-2-methylpropionate transaminase